MLPILPIRRCPEHRPVKLKAILRQIYAQTLNLAFMLLLLMIRLVSMTRFVSISVSTQMNRSRGVGRTIPLVSNCLERILTRSFENLIRQYSLATSI